MKTLCFSTTLIFVLLLSACGAPAPALPTLVPTIVLITASPGKPGTAPSATPLAEQASPTPQPAAASASPTEAAPTRAAVPGLLPAPLYMQQFEAIPSGKPQQIWRMEADGSAVRPVTAEAANVESRFDVSKDGMLAYVSQNQLIVTGAEGQNRRVLVEGQAPPAKDQRDTWWYLREEITYPTWAPDGKRLAYFQGGVNVIDVTSGQVTKIAEDANIFNDRQIADPSSVQIYTPIDWTPDGSRILLKGEGYQSVGMFLLAATPGGSMLPVETPINGENLAGCCDYSFTADGKMLFSHGRDRYIGLWLIDPQTGKGQNLTVPYASPDFPGAGIFLPKQAADGRVFFFTPEQPEGNRPVLGYWDGKILPFRAPEDVTFLKNDGTCFESQAGLWFPDASKVVIFGDMGSICLLDPATGQGTLLNFPGSGLHWGALK